MPRSLGGTDHSTEFGAAAATEARPGRSFVGAARTARGHVLIIERVRSRRKSGSDPRGCAKSVGCDTAPMPFPK